MDLRIAILHKNEDIAKQLELVCFDSKIGSLIGSFIDTTSLFDLLDKTIINIVLLDLDFLIEEGLSILKGVFHKHLLSVILIGKKLNTQIFKNFSVILESNLIDLFSPKIENERILNSQSLLVKIKIFSKLDFSKFTAHIDQLIRFIDEHPRLKEVEGEITKDFTTNYPEKIGLQEETENQKLQRIWNTTSITLKKSISTDRISSTSRRTSVVVIGASTGGPRMLTHLISQLPARFLPVLVVQHIPPGMILQFTKRINEISQIKVKRAENGETLEPDNVYFAPGGYHLELIKSNKEVRIAITDGEKVNFVKPAVDVTLKSAVNHFRSGVISVILTGMGSDGTEGSKHVKNSGGSVIALNREDSVIYGMNKSIIENGLADVVCGLSSVIPNIVKLL